MSFNGMNFGNATDIRMGQNTISALYLKNKKIWPRNPEEIYLVLTSEEDDNSFYINLTSNNLGSSTVTIEVSYDDGKHWQTFTSAVGSTNIGTIDSGERICIRGLNDTYTFTNSSHSKVDYNYFSSDGKFKASGNIMGLIYGKESDIYGTSLPSNTSFNFYYLFSRSKLTDISDLKMPATTLTEGCYMAMFTNCDELERAYNFELPATTLANYCYANMFEYCDNLLDAPILPATTLTEGCYQWMFLQCGKLNYIKMLATDISATNCLDHWVADVAPTGIFVKDFNLTSIPINSVNGIPIGWVYEEINVPTFSAVELTIQSSVANNTITYSGSDIEYLYYKIGDEGDTYEDFPAAGVTINADERLILRGELPTVLGTFASTGNFRVFGNIQSLNLYTSANVACTGGLFKNCTGLTDARYLYLPTGTAPQYAYYQMFQDCTSLETAPQINATDFNHYSCRYMFQGCTSLVTIRPMTANTSGAYTFDHMYYGCTSIKIVPYTYIGAGHYQGASYMFRGCTSLIDASRVRMPTTINDQYAFRYMFYNCTSLVNAPALPATELRGYIYQYMFYNCTSLVNAPVLPATTLAQNCYQYMFQGCTSLVNAPALPATTLAKSCYNSMFSGCTSLVNAPALPATTLAETCYGLMFLGCRNLNYVECYATDISATSCTGNWLYNVAATGTFVKDPNMNDWVLDSPNGIPVGWSDPEDWSEFPLTLRPVIYPCTFTFELHDKTSETSDIGFDYSYDYGTSWSNTGTFNRYTLTLNDGAVSIKSDHWNCTISSSQNYSAKGNIMSLIYDDNFVGQTALKTNYQFYSLLRTRCVNVNDLYLPATTLTEGCYESMFEGCSLFKLPALSATTLAKYCYKNMCKNSSLTQTPVLPATTLAYGCYWSMFENCKGLTYPPALPATTLAENCYYNMFCGSSIITTPQLNATILANACYEGMFWNSNVRTISQNSLPATKLYNDVYYNMFRGCDSLTLTDNQYNNLLPATDLTDGWYCYWGMFAGCTSLTKTVKLPATTLDTMGVCYGEMFKGCTGITSFTGVNMTGETYPVMLPATILYEYCYYHMFEGCTSLTNSLRPGNTGYVRIFPTEHKIDTNSRCFDSMFKNCTSLVNPTGWDANEYIAQSYLYMFAGCTSLTKKTNTGVFGNVYNVQSYEEDEHMYDGCTSIQNTHIALSEL